MPFFKFKSLFFFFILLLASACGNGSKTSGSGSFVSPSPSLTPSCGDSVCDAVHGETPATCPADCSTLGAGAVTPGSGPGGGGTGPGGTGPGGPSPSATCGNGICEMGESFAACASDCADRLTAGFEVASLVPAHLQMDPATTSSNIHLVVRRFGGDVSVLNFGLSNTSPSEGGITVSAGTIGSSNELDFTITVGASVPPGDYHLTLKVDGPTGARYVDFLLKVNPPTGSGTPPGGGSVCGDRTCTPPETAATCPADCGFDPSRPPVCGDGFCHPAETSSGCPADCPVGPTCDNDGLCEVGETPATCDHDCTPGGSVCGNSRCESGETTALCPADCPATRGLELVSLTPGGSRITAGTSLTEHIVVNRNSEPTTNPILVRGRDVSPIPSAGSIGLSGRIEPGSSEADLAVTVSPEVPTGNYILLLEISSPATMIPYPLAIQVVRPDSGMAPGGGTPPMGFIPPDIPYPDLPPRACINDTENIWVDDDRGDDATHEGTRARPLKSVIYARELAARASPQKNVCVFEGNYSGRSGPCSGGVCTNYTLTVDVNIYGGFAWNGSSVTRANIRDPLARRTVLTNDGGRPVVSFYSSSESKTLEGFRIIAGPQYSSGALVSIQGPALLKNNTIAIGDMAPRSPRPSESSRFMRVGVSVSTTAGNSIRNAVIESNQISVGRIYPSQGAAVGVLVENNTARGDASIVDFTVKKNQIEVGSAPVASVGILATSNRMEPVNSYRIEDNTIIYGAGLQTSDSSLLPCPSVDGSDTVTCITSESGYLGAVPGESGGIILGKKLNTGLTEPIFEDTRFTSAQILRNNIHPKLRYFGIALSGNASYGIALQNGDMYTASVVGSNIVQANRARKTSSALYLHKAMVKIYNNTLRAGLASGGNLVSCSSETIPVPGGLDEVSQDCVLDSVSSAVFVDDRIPGGTESPYFSNLDLVNNIFSGERGDATHTPVAGIFEVYNRPSSIRERSNFNSIVLLRNNFFDTSLSNPFVFYRIGEIEAWQIPFSEIVSLGTRIRYASAGGQPARSINNTRGDPGLVNPSQFEFHLLPDSPIGAGGDCSADILRLNPKEIDGTNFPSIGCAIGADQFVSP